ncbi:MAG: FAD-dependent oxidoreductase [Oscillospiraceae bacterium]|nr:FAD-dependent oxidoreductase [Oscillospiraceae bacterium]
MKEYELVIIGGGPAGLAAALAAWEKGLKSILILERDRALGGILNQCVHNGFGLHRCKEELTGPEYAGKFIDMLRGTGVQVKTDAMALEVTRDKTVRYVCPDGGCQSVQAKAVVLAMGCRERTRGAISIPGARCSGILTAGAAQRFVNIEGQMVGRRAVILGSGDIGLIMARRMTLEGAEVLACVELMPYSSGLNRNIVQCLRDFDIPLYLSHTVTDVIGTERLEKVVISAVDGKRQPIPGTERSFACDTLLLSVGLLPENELTRALGAELDSRTNGAVVYENMETSVPGVFACGNVLQVHDLVDFVSDESGRAGAAAADYVLRGEIPASRVLEVQNGNAVTYTVPQRIRVDALEKGVTVFFRVNKVMKVAVIQVRSGDKQIARFKREHMAPGEMEHIMLPGKLLAQAEGGITVSAEEGAQ